MMEDGTIEDYKQSAREYIKRIEELEVKLAQYEKTITAYEALTALTSDALRDTDQEVTTTAVQIPD